MDATEMVSRVVVEARRGARMASEVDEHEWFDAGEPDTVPNVPLQRWPLPGHHAGPPVWLLLAGTFVIVCLGYVLGFYLARS